MVISDESGICSELEVSYASLRTGDVVRFPESYYGVEIVGLVIGKEQVKSHPTGVVALWLFQLNAGGRRHRARGDITTVVSAVWPRVERLY